MQNSVSLKDFVTGRNVPIATVAQYIRRHPEAFSGHILHRQHETLLDVDAVDKLDKMYPYPRPVEVMEDTAARNALIAAQKELLTLKDEHAREIRALQDSLASARMQLAQAEATKVLLEDKEAQLERVRDELTTTQGFLANANQSIGRLEGEVSAERKKADDLAAENARLKERGLIARILNH